jgi:hypothetical protein
VNAPDAKQSEQARFGLLIVALLISGAALLREGPHFDNVLEGWHFFTITFFAGALVGYFGWTRAFGFTPMFRFGGANRHPWMAALALGLACTAAASYFNRSLASPAYRSFTAAIDSVKEGKGDRWHLTAQLPNGQTQRYLVSRDVAEALKNEQSVRLSVARGALGFDYIAGFEPVRR